MPVPALPVVGGDNNVWGSELNSWLTWLAYITATTQPAGYTLALANAGQTVEMNAATPVTVTVPTNAAVAFPVGTVIEVWQQGAGQVTFAAAGGVTIRSLGGLLSMSGQYSTAILRKRDTNEWVLTGELA